MSDVFISYAHEDRETAQKLADLIQRVGGWSVWWDRTLLPGQQFDEVIQEAIESAKCVIVIWSHHSVRSRWVKTEAREGGVRNILAPVMIEPVKLPLEFRSFEAADLAAWDWQSPNTEFEKLVGAIAQLVGTPRMGSLPGRVYASSLAATGEWPPLEHPRDPFSTEMQVSPDGCAQRESEASATQLAPQASSLQPQTRSKERAHVPKKIGLFASIGTTVILVLYIALRSTVSHPETSRAETSEQTDSSRPSEPEPPPQGTEVVPLIQDRATTKDSNEVAKDQEVVPPVQDRATTKESNEVGKDQKEPLDLMPGQYRLISSTVSGSARADSWRHSKGWLLIRKLAPDYVLLLESCGWADAPTHQCWGWWVVKYQDGAMFLARSSTGALVQIGFDPNGRTIELVYDNRRDKRMDVYRDAEGESNTDEDLRRRMARAEDSWSRTLEDDEYRKWTFNVRVSP